MRSLETVNCPRCGKEMKRGYIFSGRSAIVWREDKKKKFLDSLFSNEVLVDVGLFTANKAPALRCEECKIAIFEYEGEFH